jgi:hypothetical protein
VGDIRKGRGIRCGGKQLCYLGSVPCNVGLFVRPSCIHTLRHPHVEQGGLDVLIEDVKSWPFSAWAKAKKTLFGFDVSARGRVDSRDLENVDLDIQVNGPTTSLQFLGKGGEFLL